MSENERPKNNRVNLSIDLRFIALLLLVIIAGMLAAWRPWVSSMAGDDKRTIAVSGEAKIKAEPDEFVFQPSYQFKDANKETALSGMTKRSDEIVKKLKELGVAENQIKTNSDGYNYPDYYFDRSSNTNTYSLRLTVTTNTREVAQKVQDYLVTTAPIGQVSPQATFSEAKRKELEGKARDEATKDARAKADQSAKNLGFKVGKVKSIEDGTDLNGIRPFGPVPDVVNDSAESKPAQLSVQPGENDLSYQVKVVYYVR